jgi:hypothetical protein
VVGHSLLYIADFKSEWDNTPTSSSMSSHSVNRHLYVFLLFISLFESSRKISADSNGHAV